MYNYRNMAVVINHIEEHRDNFDLHYHFYKDPECGTVACLAGWTCILLDPDFEVERHANPASYYEDTGQKLLGLSDEECEIFLSFHDPDEIIKLLKYTVRQQHQEASKRQTLAEIADDFELNIFKWWENVGDDEEIDILGL